MKLTLRDLFWLILTLGLGLAWYVNSHQPVAVRVGELVSIVSIAQVNTDEVLLTYGMASAVSRDRIQVDTATSTPTNGVALNRSGQCLGITYTANGVGYVRRLHAFPLLKVCTRGGGRLSSAQAGKTPGRPGGG